MAKFNTTLTADIGQADLMISVADNTGAPTTYPARFFIDDECVYVLGGVAEGLDWDIGRAREGTDAADHATSSAVIFTPIGDGTGIVTYSGAFDTALVQTANDSVTAQANDGAGDMAAKLTLLSGGAVTLEGVAGAGALSIADGTTPPVIAGTVTIGGTALSFSVGSDTGSQGQTLVGRGPTDDNVEWQSLVTVQTGAPGGTYVTPFIFDDTATTGGMFWWDGTAYTRTGLATT